MGKKSISKLGDLRLEKAFTLLVGAMVVRYTSVLRQLGKDRSEEVRFGRFINNPKVTPEQLVAHHCSQWSPSFGGKHLLVISDSTTVSFGPHASRRGLGYVGAGTGKSGLRPAPVHPCGRRQRRMLRAWRHKRPVDENAAVPAGAGGQGAKEQGQVEDALRAEGPLQVVRLVASRGRTALNRKFWQVCNLHPDSYRDGI